MPIALRTTALLFCALLLAACNEPLAEQVLARAGYGPDAWTRQRLEDLGLVAYLDEQLSPASIPDDAFQAMEAAYPVLGLNYKQLHDGYDDSTILTQLSEAKILRAIYSRRQLEAVLIDFWFDHFNVYAGSGLVGTAIAPYERDVIAPRVLGRFEELLVAVAQSAAMADYLDNNQNSLWGLNENYARELMELHTLGVDGPYTETDVREVARCLTGWTTDYDGDESETGFLYRPGRHDDDAKLVLGSTIAAGGGMQDGLDVLHILSTHPVTAEHVSRKLARRLLAAEPSDATVESMRDVWLASDGDLREVTTALLLSSDFVAEGVNGKRKVKRPLVLMAGMARALQVSGEDMADQLRGDLEGLGEVLFLARPPTGYPEAPAYWAGNGTLLGRFNILYAIAMGWHGLDFTLDETGTPEELADALATRLQIRALSTNTRDAAIAYLESLPEWVQSDPDESAREMLGILMASPEFLTH
jgi:uncharacterized protein (DUF1800 family)